MRICEQLSEEQEDTISRIAELILNEWVLFSIQGLFGATRNDFLDLNLSEHGVVMDEQNHHWARECLFRHLVRADARITPIDEEKLRKLRDELRKDDTAWPGREDYVQRLREVVREGFSEKPLSDFRCNWLVAELSRLLIGVSK